MLDNVFDADPDIVHDYWKEIGNTHYKNITIFILIGQPILLLPQ